MVGRAYSPKDIERKRYDRLEWEDEWSEPFGSPAANEMWFISGPSASGKSSFVMAAKEGSYETGWCHTDKYRRASQKFQYYHLRKYNNIRLYERIRRNS